MASLLFGNGQRDHQLSPNNGGGPGAVLSEQSPLLRALGAVGASSSYEGSYMSMPLGGYQQTYDDTHSSEQFGQFRPIVYAEKSLGALLNGVLMYALCCVIGVALVSLNVEGILGSHINWWLIFLPFWIANICILVAHISSIRYAKELRKWAEVETMSNEPLLPLLRRIITFYAVTFPLSVLLLWSELAFCARLQDSRTNLYLCFAPWMVIQVACIIRYLLCRSDSTVPGVCWVLSFVFTLLLAYQTNGERYSVAEGLSTFPLSWWTVFAPLFTLEALLALALCVVLYYEFTGIYRLTRWQLGASVLYALALIPGCAGELMLLEHMNYHWGTIAFPSALMFFGLVCASVAIYIVGRHHVQELMATRGGAVPVPLTRTSEGWITSHAVVEQWVLFGDIHLTQKGLRYRNEQKKANQSSGGRRNSDSETESAGARLMRRLKQLLRRGRSHEEESLSRDDPERRIQNMRQRKTSGSYSEINVDTADTPR